jgi:hypothetical protein
MKRIAIFAFLSLALVILPAMPAGGQTTYNLDIIWQKQGPDTIEIRAWGIALGGGDVNGDGKSDVIIASEANYNDGGFTGRVYIFTDLLDTVPDVTLIGDTICSAYGHVVCTGDFNGDGFADVSVGAPEDNDLDFGRVYIYYGGNPMDNTPDWIKTNNISGERFGQSLSSGDINGDGIDDLIIGSPNYGESNARGRVYIYYGDTLGLHTWPDIILNGHTEAGYYENFGNSIDGTEDMNHDGYNDLIVGAYLNAKNANSAGKVYCYLSDNAPIDTIADGWVYGEGYEQWLGAFGLSSIMTDTSDFSHVGWYGTPIWNNPSGGFGRGKCYMVPGDILGEIAPLWTITGNDLTDSALGYWSCSAGYADNDKLGDMLSSALVAFDDPGKVYLWLRRANMRQQPDAYIIGRASTPGGDALGGRIAPAGDVDGDGRDEFLVSNYFADTDHMVWLCKYTGPDGVAGEPEFKIQNSEFKIYQNAPNPFGQITNIKYQIAKSGQVSLNVYNIAGQLVRALVDENKKMGSYEVEWNGRDNRGQRVSNGVYIYKLNMEGKCIAKKMTLLR